MPCLLAGVVQVVLKTPPCDYPDISEPVKGRVKLIAVMIYLIFIWKMDSKVIRGLSVSHTNLLNIVKGYKSRGRQGDIIIVGAALIIIIITNIIIIAFQFYDSKYCLLYENNCFNRNRNRNNRNHEIYSIKLLYKKGLFIVI